MLKVTISCCLANSYTIYRYHISLYAHLIFILPFIHSVFGFLLSELISSHVRHISLVRYWILAIGYGVFSSFFVGLVHAHRASVAQLIVMCPFCIVFAFVFGFVFVAFVLISWTIDSWVSFLWVSCQSVCLSVSLSLTLYLSLTVSSFCCCYCCSFSLVFFPFAFQQNIYKIHKINCNINNATWLCSGTQMNSIWHRLFTWQKTITAIRRDLVGYR